MSCRGVNDSLQQSKKKRLHEGGVGPEMRSPAGLIRTIVKDSHRPVKKQLPSPLKAPEL